MATQHTLFRMTARTDTEDGVGFPLAGRSRGTFTLSVADVTDTLAIAIDATADGETWDVLHTFTVSVRGVTTVAAPADFTLQPYHRFVRGRIVQTTRAVFELTASLPFIDATVGADQNLFSKELRSFADGFARLVDQAEDDVLTELLRSATVPRSGARTDALPLWGFTGYGTTDRYGVSLYDSDPDAADLASEVPDELVVDARFDIPGFGDAMRAAVVKQCEHLHRRHKLQLANDASSITTLRDMPDLAPGLMRQLGKFRNQSTFVWRGR
jgi:hypothetical protein